MRKKILTFLFFFIYALCFSQTLNDTIAQIEKVMSFYLPQNPGCQLSIKNNGRVIFSKAYGMADLEHNVPMALTSKIEAGSVSKQFTAAAILLLQQQGRLSLTDDIRRFIPEFPNYGHIITLDHMMRHTSGLKDWGAVAALTGEGRFSKNHTNEDVLRIAMAQKTLNNIPGAEYLYSNSNYNLLAIVVERASGQSLAEFTKQHIFTPAGMTHTEWRNNHKRIVKDRAIAYRLSEGMYETEMPNEDAYGSGGLLTTTGDLLKWNDFYRSGKLGTASLFLQQIATKPLLDGKANNYAAGLEITTYKGNSLVTHNGATAGYRSFLEIFPDLNLSIAFLGNTSEFDGKKAIERAIRDIFTKDLSIPENEKTVFPVNASRTVLASYSGWYRNERNGAGLMVEFKDDALYINNTKLTSETMDTFRLGKSKTRVKFDAGKKTMAILTENDTIPLGKAEAAAVSEKYLSQFTGRYFSDETGSFITITIKDGIAVISFKPGMETQLIPTYTSAFDIPGWGNLYFTEGQGKITGMKISVGRARNVEFKKLN